MRIEVAGAQVTDDVVDVLDTLQNHRDVVDMYVRTLDELTRSVILDVTAADDESDTSAMSKLRVLQMIRRDLTTLATPPDVDDPARNAGVFTDPRSAPWALPDGLIPSPVNGRFPEASISRYLKGWPNITSSGAVTTTATSSRPGALFGTNATSHPPSRTANWPQLTCSRPSGSSATCGTV